MKFSLILAALNSGPLLKDAVDSFSKQSWQDIEIVVQDGGSDDGSPEALAGSGDARLLVRSEPDTGIYDAWNKALARASGDWALFLGADDRLFDDAVLERCAPLLRELPEHIDFAYGDLIISRRGRHRQCISRTLRTVYSIMLTDMGLPFPSTFVRLRGVGEKPFDPSFRIAGDYDFAARLMTSDNVARLPLTVAVMDGGGISDNDAYTPQLREERRRITENRVIPRAQEFARGAAAHLDESPCCSARKRIRPFKEWLRRLRGGSFS